MPEVAPGLVVLFGSGEIAPSAQSVYDHVFRKLSSPIRLAVLETPAGFELNSPQVAGRIADYVAHHLRNHSPGISVIPARRRGTPYSPDEPSIMPPLLESNAIFLGPGSPTYAVRQLKGSLAWQILQARHRLGGAIIMASAATIAASAWALPVYEVYKVGQDPHWVPGLDLFGPLGLRLVFVPHWDNQEGGAELDTSRAFMGRSRFEPLLQEMQNDVTVIGIDEHTALVIDCANETCQVMGRGNITLIGKDTAVYHSGETLPLSALGTYTPISPDTGLAPAVWRQALEAHQRSHIQPEPPPGVVSMAQARDAARARRDWAEADSLRERARELGWQINDTPAGSELVPIRSD